MEPSCTVVVTGASGLLGRALMDHFTTLPTIDRVVGLSHSRTGPNLEQVDLTDTPRMREMVRGSVPNIVVHCAAQRFPDRVDADYPAAVALNVDASRELALVCKEIGATLLYISTDYVFDGLSPPYSHTDSPNPTNKYGETKLKGEKAVLEVDPENIVLRVPVLYGPVESLGESAVTVLLNTVQNSTKPANLSSYEVRCPAHSRDIARILGDMIGRLPGLQGGVYQWSGLEKLSKWDMVQILAKHTNTDINHITEVKEPSKGGTQRPRDVEMSREKLEELGISHHTPFAEGLVEALKPFL